MMFHLILAMAGIFGGKCQIIVRKSRFAYHPTIIYLCKARADRVGVDRFLPLRLNLEWPFYL